MIAPHAIVQSNIVSIYIIGKVIKMAFIKKICT